MSDEVDPLDDAMADLAACASAQARAEALQKEILAEQRAIRKLEQALVREEDDVRAMRRWGFRRIGAVLRRRRTEELRREEDEAARAHAELELHRATLDQLVADNRAAQLQSERLPVARANLDHVLAQQSNWTGRGSASGDLAAIDAARVEAVLALTRARDRLTATETAVAGLREAHHHLAWAGDLAAVNTFTNLIDTRSPWSIDGRIDRWSDAKEEEVEIARAGTGIAMANHGVRSLRAEFAGLPDDGLAGLSPEDLTALDEAIERFVLESTTVLNPRATAGAAEALLEQLVPLRARLAADLEARQEACEVLAARRVAARRDAGSSVDD